MYKEIILDLKKSFINNNHIIESQRKIGNDIYHYYLKDKNDGKINGNYYVIKNNNSDFLYINHLFKKVNKALRIIFKKEKINKVLVIGLGHSNNIADSFGQITTNKILLNNKVTDFYNNSNISIYNLESCNKTGIKTSLLIKSIISFNKPDAILLIDSLVTKDEGNLNRTIEITDNGFIPGYFLKDNKIIDKKTFGIPIIRIGLALAISVKNNIYSSIMVNDVVDRYSSLIAKIISKIFIST